MMEASEARRQSRGSLSQLLWEEKVSLISKNRYELTAVRPAFNYTAAKALSAAHRIQRRLNTEWMGFIRRCLLHSGGWSGEDERTKMTQTKRLFGSPLRRHVTVSGFPTANMWRKKILRKNNTCSMEKL